MEFLCLFTLYINIKLQGLIFCFTLTLIGLFPFFCLSEYPFKRIKEFKIHVSHTGFNSVLISPCMERILGGGHYFPEQALRRNHLSTAWMIRIAVVTMRLHSAASVIKNSLPFGWGMTVAAFQVGCSWIARDISKELEDLGMEKSKR